MELIDYISGENEKINCKNNEICLLMSIAHYHTYNHNYEMEWARESN